MRLLPPWHSPEAVARRMIAGLEDGELALLGGLFDERREPAQLGPIAPPPVPETLRRVNTSHLGLEVGDYIGTAANVSPEPNEWAKDCVEEFGGLWGLHYASTKYSLGVLVLLMRRARLIKVFQIVGFLLVTGLTMCAVMQTQAEGWRSGLWFGIGGAAIHLLVLVLTLVLLRNNPK